MNNNWQTKKLGDICGIYNGGTPDTKITDYWGDDHYWITPKDMGKLTDIYIEETSRKLTDAGLKNSSAKVLPPNSIILSSRAPIGHLAINTVPMSTNQGCKGLVPKKKIDHLYIFYFLLGSVDLLNSLGSGTTFKELSGSKLADICIPLPPLPEQHRIVKILDEAFDKIEKAKVNAEKNLQNAKELFESYLQDVFAETNNKWQMRALGDKEILQIIDGDRGKNYPKKSDFLQEGYCLFLNTKNVRSDGFDFKSTMFVTKKKDDELGNGKLQRNDVLLTTRGTIGNIAIYDNNVSFENIRINSGMLIFRPNIKLLLPEYLFSIFQSGIMKTQIKKYVSGAAQPQLPIKTLINFLIPVPKSLVEQKSIVAKLDALSAETKKLEAIYQKKLADLEELKKSVLKKAFAGEL